MHIIYLYFYIDNKCVSICSRVVLIFYNDLGRKGDIESSYSSPHIERETARLFYEATRLRLTAV